MDEKEELATMTTRELEAYRRICAMGLRCISDAGTRELNQRHAKLVDEILAERATQAAGK